MTIGSIRPFGRLCVSDYWHESSRLPTPKRQSVCPRAADDRAVPDTRGNIEHYAAMFSDIWG